MNTLKPETSAEIIWMLFSLLILEPTQQLEILGELPYANQANERLLSENGAAYLLTAIQTFYVSWLDEFEPCPYAQQLFDLVWGMDYKQSYESFMNGDDWKQLRKLAKYALEEASLMPWPVPQVIDFREFIEIV